MWNCCHLATSSVHTIQPCTSVQCHFIWSHIRRMRKCLAVTCHLHFWQSDRDLLHATAVARGWNGYWNKNQHVKLTLRKKIQPPLLLGLEPRTFQSRVQCCNQWAIFHSLSLEQESGLWILTYQCCFKHFCFFVLQDHKPKSSITLSWRKQTFSHCFWS